MKKARTGGILIIEQDQENGLWIKSVLVEHGYHFKILPELVEPSHKAFHENPDLVIVDQLSFSEGLLAYARTLREAGIFLPIIFLAQAADPRHLACLGNHAPAEFIKKPAQASEVLACVERLISSQVQTESLVEANARELHHPVTIIHNCAAMRAILEHLMKMAAYQLPIFLQGESGTGKTTLAQFLHNQSNRQAQPFISCDLSALPGQIIEREIFGVPASASGGGKPGLLDRAKGGTVYLQEIGKLPPIAQQKLYVYLNEKKLPGQARETAPGARVVLGSVQPLSELQAQGDLRQDLAAMMEEFSLRIPPLREREGDIEILAQHFLKQYKLEFQKKVKAFSVEALLILHRYTWPGNIPELQQKIKHGVILADELIEPRHLLPEEMRPEASTADAAKESWLAMKPLRQLCQELARKVERETIQQVLAETRWNKMQAAKLLKINYKTLFNKIKEYGL